MSAENVSNDVQQSSEACDLDAVTARRLIDEKDLLPSELLESCIRRIEQTNGAVNAVVTTCHAQARETARLADLAVRDGHPLQPLHGLPVLIKDLTETKGLRTTYGSLCHADNVPGEDAAIVNRLRKAGAIVFGKTNTPEFGAGANTFNKLFGATRNPFDTRLTCGGSSGGSAVSVACGMAPLSTGSDFGGSLRIPASFNSVVGVRPSPGTIPSTAHALAFSPLWTDGPIARTVADAALCMQAIAGYEPGDPRSRPGAEDMMGSTSDAAALSGLRMGYSDTLGIATVEHGIARTFAAGMERLRGCFANAGSVDLDLSAAWDIFRVLRVEDVCAGIADVADAMPDMIGDNVRANIMEAGKLSLSDVARAGSQHSRLFRKFQRIFDDIDILICPATAVSPFPVEQNHPETVNGEPLNGYFAWYSITWALSLMGCPIVSLPFGKDHNGMPFGIQIVGPRHEDAFVLGVAAAIEKTLAASPNQRILPDLETLASR